MKKVFIAFLFAIISFNLFAEDLKGAMGIEFGSSIEEVEAILFEKNWKLISNIQLKKDQVGSTEKYEGDLYNVGIQKNYSGGIYGNIKNLDLHLYFLVEEDKTSLYKIEFMDSLEEGPTRGLLNIEAYSKFADVLDALITKYDWESTEGTESIRELSRKFYYKTRQEIKYYGKNKAKIYFLRKENRIDSFGYAFRYLTEYLTFTYEPLNSLYENKLQIEKEKEAAKEAEHIKKEAEEKERLRLEKLNNLQGDL